jgi:hypothetical protein
MNTQAELVGGPLCGTTFTLPVFPNTLWLHKPRSAPLVCAEWEFPNGTAYHRSGMDALGSVVYLLGKERAK